MRRSENTSRTFRENIHSYCYIRYYCNAISKQEYLSHHFGSLAPLLCGAVSLFTLCDWMRPFLQARLFYLAGPRWLSPVKRRKRWSVFAVMVNERNDTECENVLMTPLETALLEEAVSIRPPTPYHLLPRVSHDVGRDFSLEMMWNYIVRGNGYNVCLKPQDRLWFSNNSAFLFLFFSLFFENCHQTSAQRGNAKIFRCKHFTAQQNNGWAWTMQNKASLS